MKKTNLIFSIFIISISIFSNIGQAQTTDNYFLYQESKGDLNKDNIIDKVVVLKDTINPKSAYKIQIYFEDANGSSNLVLESDKAVISDFPDAENIDDRYADGHYFDKITIKNGLLIISVDLMRGHYEHKYRYQNNTFELIGYSKVSGSGIAEDIEKIDFNLSTGLLIYKYENDKPKEVKNIQKNIQKNPLPKIDEQFDIDEFIFQKLYGTEIIKK